MAVEAEETEAMMAVEAVEAVEAPGGGIMEMVVEGTVAMAAEET